MPILKLMLKILRKKLPFVLSLAILIIVGSFIALKTSLLANSSPDGGPDVLPPGKLLDIPSVLAATTGTTWQNIGSDVTISGTTYGSANGIYAKNSDSRYIDMRANGSGNDLESVGADLYINYSGKDVHICESTNCNAYLNRKSLVTSNTTGMQIIAATLTNTAPSSGPTCFNRNNPQWVAYPQSFPNGTLFVARSLLAGIGTTLWAEGATKDGFKLYTDVLGSADEPECIPQGATFGYVAIGY